MAFVSTVFYLLPIFMRVHDNLQITSMLRIILFQAETFFTMIATITSSPLLAGVVVEWVILILALEGVFLKLIVSPRQKKEE